MSTINEDVSAIKTIQDGLVNNKVARFSYTQKAYIDNIVDGVDTYNVNNEQNIPNGTAEIMKVNDTIINKGYRAQASSITRMLMNHFLGRISYNLNKVNDNMKSLIDSLNSHLGKKNGIATLDANAKLPKTQLPDILGKANGIATLDANAKLPKTQLPDILGKANGIATLDANAKLPQTQLPDILGKKNGIATLDANAKLPKTQLPDILGKANGIATLDANAKLPQTQLPDISPDLSRAKEIILKNGNLVTWHAEFDCWILEVNAPGTSTISLAINGKTDYTPEYFVRSVIVDGRPHYIVNPVFRCPYFVKKGTLITLDGVIQDGAGIIVAPCKYVNA